MFILSKGQSKEYTEDELSFLKGLADQASLAITNAQLFENVRDSRFRLQYLSKRLVEVQEAERRAMARELHDQIGQMLTGLQFSLESGKRKASEETKIIFDDAQEIVSDLIRQVRELSLRLLPSMLDDIGLFPTLQWHFEQYTNQTGIHVNFSQSGLEEKRLPQNVEITAYRIIQEGLTNTARHAQVDKVNVGIQVDDSVVRLNISDTGKGFDPERTVISRKTFGLIGMRERTTLVGGILNVKSTPGKGTKLEAYLPLGNHIERRKYAR
jgi:signal transduction histidine kinase